MSLCATLLACAEHDEAGARDAVAPTADDVQDAATAGEDASSARDGSRDVDAEREPDGAADEGAGSAGEQIAGLARTFSFAQLEDADAQALCRWQNEQRASLAPSLREQCTLTGAASTQDESTCKTQTESCVLAGSLGNSRSDCSTIRAAGLPTSCAALSAGEYGDCVVTALSAQRARVTGVTCADAGHVAPSESLLPAVCAPVEAHCSVLLP